MRIIVSIAILIAVSSCTAPKVGVWNELVVEAGHHDFKPNSRYKGEETAIMVDWLLDPSCQYELPGIDQCDWNKGWGLAFFFFFPFVCSLTNHEDSAIWSWRWNTDGFWQWAPYYHNDGDTEWADTFCVWDGIPRDGSGDIPDIRVYPDDDGFGRLKTFIELDDGWVVMTAMTDNEIITHREWFGVETDNGWTAIGAWFGGNQKAPHMMKMSYVRR